MEMLDVCKEKWKRWDKHDSDSVDVRDNVQKNTLSIQSILKEIIRLDAEIKVVKSGVVKGAAIGGVIGALIGSNCSFVINEFLNLFIQSFTKGVM